jgi:hypothetical protein
MEKGRGKWTDTLQTDNVFTRNEYIEREAAVMKIREWFWSAPGVHPKLDRDAAEEILFAIPAADVAPARHGKWIVSRTDYGWNSAEFPTRSKCDQCGREVPYQDRDNYCPACGARMDKDGDA